MNANQMQQTQNSVRRVLVAQAVFALAVAGTALLVTLVGSGVSAVATLGLARAGAAMFGSLLGMLSTVVTARSVLKSARAASAAPHFGMLPLYSGLVFKLLIVAGGAFAALVWLRLDPLWLTLGYLAMQIGYLWAGRAAGQDERKTSGG